jgi:hypothetical protein
MIGELQRIIPKIYTEQVIVSTGWMIGGFESR